jgi:hypothetical protein
MKWKFFIGACILVSGLMIKFGAPLLAVAMGIALAAFLNWKRIRLGVPPPREKPPTL